MKIFLLFVILLFTSPLIATTYYIAPAGGGGSDANNGTSSGTPWLSPNHAVNCGDVILAAAGVYSASNFNNSVTWGTVTCSAGNNVAWLECVTFLACSITSSTNFVQAISPTANYWGVQGWFVTSSGSYATCFFIKPTTTNGANLHHIIFANNVASTCGGNGFASANNGTAGVDYIVYLGNIAYNAATDSSQCFSGMSVYEPVATDSLPGTHIYIAGNFAWGNVDPAICNSGASTDGEGFIADTWDGSGGGVAGPYRQQGVVDNNLFVGNGGRGLLLWTNGQGTAPFARIYTRHNTSWGNNTDLNQNKTACGEEVLDITNTTESFYDLAVTNATNGCGANPNYAFYVYQGTSTDHVYNDWGYSAAGNNNTAVSSSGFSFGPNNTFGPNPSFTNPVVPGAPSCGSASSVPNCMATVIANFTPTNAAAKSYGYQIPSTTSVYDPLYPQWLCTVTNLPAGLVTPGCVQAESVGGSIK